MLLLKSFFRKKTTKIYFIIICLIFSIFLFVDSSRNYYNKFIKDYELGYRLIFKSSKSNYNSIKEIKNIKDIYLALENEEISEIWYIIRDDNSSLRDNEIMIPPKNKVYNPVNSTLNFTYNNNLFTFVIKDFNNYENNYDFKINAKVFDDIASSKDIITYIVSLKKYSNKDQTIAELSEKINDDIRSINVKTSNPNLDTFEVYHNLLFILELILLFAFTIVLVITISNIILDESKITFLYSCLGFNKTQIRNNSIKKIFILIISALILSFCIFYTISSLF